MGAIFAVSDEQRQAHAAAKSRAFHNTCAARRLIVEYRQDPARYDREAPDRATNRRREEAEGQKKQRKLNHRQRGNAQALGQSVHSVQIAHFWRDRGVLEKVGQVPRLDWPGDYMPLRELGELLPYTPAQSWNDHCALRRQALDAVQAHERRGPLSGEEPGVARAPDIPSARILHDQVAALAGEREPQLLHSREEVPGEQDGIVRPRRSHTIDPARNGDRQREPCCEAQPGPDESPWERALQRSRISPLGGKGRGALGRQQPQRAALIAHLALNYQPCLLQEGLPGMPVGWRELLQDKEREERK